MVKQYTEQAYLPAARAFLRRQADGARLARELEHWHQQLQEGWPSLRFGQVDVRRVDDQWHFEVQAYLGELCPDWVILQLYAEPSDGEAPNPVQMHREGPIYGAVNGFSYTASVPADRPAEHYTPRIIPGHRDAFVPLEEPRIHWRS